MLEIGRTYIPYSGVSTDSPHIRNPDALISSRHSSPLVTSRLVSSPLVTSPLLPLR